MRTLAGVVAWLSVAPMAFAEVTVIYRRSDRTVAGIVQPPQSVEQEIRNLTQSELSGAAEDYATASVTDLEWSQRGTQVVAIDANGRVVFLPDEAFAAQQALQASAREKLLALGLTDEEIDALLAN